MKNIFIALTITSVLPILSSEISLPNHSNNSPFKKPWVTSSETSSRIETTQIHKDFFKINIEAKLESFKALHEHGTKKIIQNFSLKESESIALYQTIATKILRYYVSIHDLLKDNEDMSIHKIPLLCDCQIKFIPGMDQTIKLYHVAVWSIAERLQTTLLMILKKEHINIKDTKNYLCTRTILTDILDKKTN